MKTRNKKEIYIIVGISIVFYFVVSFLLPTFHYYVIEGHQGLDTSGYIEAAKEMYQQGFKANIERGEGYPLLLGIPCVFKADYSTIIYWGVFLNFIAWIFTSILIFKTLNLLTGNKKIALLSACIFCILIGNIEYVNFALSETIYTFILTLIAYFTAKYIVTENITSLGWAFFIYCYSIITRPILMVLLPVLLFLILVHVIKKRNSIGFKKMRTFLMIILSGITIILGQMLLMKKDYGTFTLSIDGQKTVYVYIGSYVHSMETGDDLHLEKNRRGKEYWNYFNKGEWDSIKYMASNDMWHNVKYNKIKLFKALCIDIYFNSAQGGDFAISQDNDKALQVFRNMCTTVSGYMNLLISFIAGALIVLVFLLRRKLKNKLLLYCILLWIIPVALILISGISFWQNNRFHIPIPPLVLINIGLLISVLTGKATQSADINSLSQS